MEFHCYILFSRMLNKFYVGSTSELLEVRINQHNTSFYGINKYTHSATDWELHLSIKCISRKQAESVEKHIKSMKSIKYITNLKKYPEMQTKLLEKYCKC